MVVGGGGGGGQCLAAPGPTASGHIGDTSGVVSSGHNIITTEKIPRVPASPRSTATAAPPTAKKLPAKICGFLLPHTRVNRRSSPCSCATVTNDLQFGSHTPRASTRPLLSST